VKGESDMVGRYGEGGWHSTTHWAPNGGAAPRTCTREGAGGGPGGAKEKE
jgi:hypothetical protein